MVVATCGGFSAGSGGAAGGGGGGAGGSGAGAAATGSGGGARGPSSNQHPASVNAIRIESEAWRHMAPLLGSVVYCSTAAAMGPAPRPGRTGKQTIVAPRQP